MPIETLKVGSLGTLHTLGLAHEKGARYVLASTSEVYGDPLQHPQSEEYWGNVNPVGPRGVYDEAKRFSEALTTAYRTSKGTDTGIVRIFNTYGPRMRPDDGRAIPAFIGQALSGRPADRGRRRLPDPLDLLRRRHRPRHPRHGVLRPRGSGQHRQPRRAVHAAAGPLDRRADRLGLRRSSSSTCRWTTRRSVVRTRPAPRSCWAGGRTVPAEEGLRRTVAWFAAQRASRRRAPADRRAARGSGGRHLRCACGLGGPRPPRVEHRERAWAATPIPLPPTPSRPARPDRRRDRRRPGRRRPRLVAGRFRGRLRRRR